MLVNRKPIDAYFPDLLLRSAALKPLSVTGLMGQVDVLVQVGAVGAVGAVEQLQVFWVGWCSSAGIVAGCS